jgi:hypothetical protein
MYWKDQKLFQFTTHADSYTCFYEKSLRVLLPLIDTVRRDETYTGQTFCAVLVLERAHISSILFRKVVLSGDDHTSN